jgi:hypothetical protein
MVTHWVLYKQLHLYAKCRLPRIWSQLQAAQVVDIQLNIYQQDGIRWHWSLHVRETLMRTFLDYWIGCDRPISCPLRLPVSLSRISVSEVCEGMLPVCLIFISLRDFIHGVIVSVTPGLLDRTWQEFENRLNIVCATNGSHIKVY